MRKYLFVLIAIVALSAGVFCFSNINSVKADASKEMVIREGVFIGGINVSGMTQEEATKAVESYVLEIQEHWITLVGPKNTLRYQLKDLGLTARTDAAVQEAVGIGNTGSFIKRFKELKDLEKENRIVDMGLAIDKQLTANKIHGKRSKIDIKVVNNGVKRVDNTFVYVPGKDGNEVDIVASVNELNEYIGTTWEIAPVEKPRFTLSSSVTHPRGTEEEVSVIKDLLGSFTTNYKSSGWGRAKNVENGAEKINGIILYPGEEFSVYEAVNPFTKENGYELAGSYLNGETVESFGGGICQVSTTLYNAVLNAELEITQRYSHSMIVTYVDPSADAAIAGTYKDFRFKNNYDFPVYIEGVYKNRNLTFNIYGVETRDANRKVSYVSEIVSTNDPDTEYTLSSSRPVGSYVQTRSKHIGYVAKLWKVVTVNGVEQERTQVNKSTYKASCKKVTIGTKGATPEQIEAIKKALATKDDAYIKSVVNGLTKPAATTPVTQEDPNKDQSNEENPESTPTTPEETPVETPDEALDEETDINE